MNILIGGITAAYIIIIISLRYIKSPTEASKYLLRKTVHTATGLIILFLTYYIDNRTMLVIILIGTVFAILTYVIKIFNFIHTTSETSRGTLFYPFGVLAALLILYNLPTEYFRISLLLLSVSDTLANLGGKIKWGNSHMIILSEKKSIWGISFFCISAFIITHLLLPGNHVPSLPYSILAVIAAINCEIISAKGSDNLTVPAGSALFFYSTHNLNENALPIIIIILITALGSWFLYRRNILTRYGSLGTYFLGIYFFGILGWSWSIPVVFFFLTAAGLTMINTGVNKKSRDSNRRNIWQVSVNIAAAVVLSIAYLYTKDVLYIYLFITAVAAVTGDTWASEIGPTFSKKCFSLSDFSIQDSGISGGISISGTLASFAGPFLIALVGYYLFFSYFDFNIILLIAMSGTAASFVDSLLGAFAENYLNRISFFKNSDDPERLSPNDVINLSSSTAAPFIFLAIYTFF